ncbi:MAG: acyl-CoA dehydrogenase family protein [Nitrososphaerota archaeon]
MHIDLEPLITKYGPEYRRERDGRKIFPEEFWRDVAGMRLPGALIPAEYGGLGLGLASLCDIVIHLSSRGFSTGLYPLLTNAMSSLVLLGWGSDLQKRELLPLLSSGSAVIGLSVTERDSGSDALSIRTVARREGGFYVIRGSKMFVNNVDRATHLLLLARTTPVDIVEKKSMGLTLFLVDTKSGGLSYRALDKLGTNYVTTCELILEDVHVREEDVVGPVDGGWKVLVSALNADRIVYAALAIGSAQFALERGIKYACERKVFGRPIGANQGVQFPLAEDYVKVEAARLLCLDAARRFDSGERVDVIACMAKYYATEVVLKTLEHSLQVLGGYGYLREWDLERVFRDMLMLRVGPITQELALAYIGEKGLRLPKSF